jgi:hypothetical protein
VGLFNDFETSKDAEKQGVWVDYGDYRLRIARSGGRNQGYIQALAKATKPHRRAIIAGHIKEAQMRAIMVPVYAKYVLVGWEGVATREGDPIDYSVEKAQELLTELPDFFEEVQSRSSDISLFQDADGTEVAAGN